MSSHFKDIFSLTGITSVIIGGGGHICSSLAHGLADFGSRVVIADLRLEKAESVAEAINSQGKSVAYAFQADATNKKSLQDLLAFTLSELGSINCLINGAGINSPTPFLEIDENEWNSVIDSQLNATFLGCQVFGESMISRGSGSIINVSSASADPPLSKAFAYSASKAGIRNLTQNLGREWATKGVRVNALRPGFFPTDWNKKNFITPEREAAILGHTPMRRFGETRELVGACIFLASNASSFVTGSELVVDGGFSAMTI
jgi:NAD(P)-dependent dehydrogenase (short-subunit alcohol dehydrogenase family)